MGTTIELPRITLKNLEARGGFEPPHKGFADLSLNRLGTAPSGKSGAGIEFANPGRIKLGAGDGI